MSGKSITIATLLAFVAFVLSSLLRGAPYLEAPLFAGLPLGNLLVALALCAMAGASLALSQRGTARRTAALLALAGAVAWLPVSAALAGNLQLNFGNGRGAAWHALSVAVFAGACSTLLWGLGASVFAKFRRPDTA